MTDADSGIRSIAKEGSITFLGNIFGKGLRFAFVAVVTRLVSPGAYGTYTLGLSIVLFLQGFASLNLNRSIDYFVPQFLRDDVAEKARGVLANVLFISLVMSIVGAIAVAIVSPHLAELFEDPKLAEILPIFALLLPIVTLNKILQDSFKSIKVMKYRVYTRDILNPLARMFSAVIFIYLTSELVGLVLGHLTGFIIAVVAGGFFLLRNADWLRNKQLGAISRRRLVSYSIPLMFAGVIYSFVGQVDYFVIGYFLSSDDVAFYRVALMLAMNTLIILQAIAPIFKPTVAGNQSDLSLIQDRYQTVTRWITILTLPIALTFLLAPEEYLSILFTKKYTVASGAFIALTIGYLLNATLGPEGMMLEGLGHTRLTFVNTVILVSTNAALDVILVTQFGIIGAGIATGTALTVAGIAGVVEIYLIKGIHPYSLNLVRVWIAIIPAAVLGFLLVSLLDQALLVAILLPGVVGCSYLVCLRSLGIFTAEDRKIVSGLQNPVVRPLLDFLMGR